MSKVVHLSDDAHARAKRHCQHAGLKMSEWVAVLIERATAEAAAEPAPVGSSAVVASLAAPEVKPSVARTATVATVATVPGGSDEPDAALPLYAAPPFWARSGATKVPPLADPRSPI